MTQETEERLRAYLPVVKAVAGLSKDPSTKVGAIALDDGRAVIASGYNGFPRGVVDCSHQLASREKKYPRTVHAEANLVANATRSGSTLKGSTVIVYPLPPCSQCAGLLIQAGVSVVAVASPGSVSDTWAESWSISLEMLTQAGVTVVQL